jgi:hypothetical protein
MAGNKTHHQQINIIEKRVNTANAGDEFDAEADLAKPEQERRARAAAGKLKDDPKNLVDPDDRNMLRGKNQESQHRKDRPDR